MEDPKPNKDTPLYKLKFLSSHNTMLLSSQLSGVIGFDALKLFLDQLENTPVCIELDISKNSVITLQNNHVICDDIYIDHEAKVFNSYSYDLINHDPGKKIINNNLEEFKKIYNICSVFNEINKYLDIKEKLIGEKKLFPLIINIDHSHIESEKKNEILPYILEQFQYYFDKKRKNPALKRNSEDIKINIDARKESEEKAVTTAATSEPDVKKLPLLLPPRLSSVNEDEEEGEESVGASGGGIGQNSISEIEALLSIVEDIFNYQTELEDLENSIAVHDSNIIYIRQITNKFKKLEAVCESQPTECSEDIKAQITKMTNFIKTLNLKTTQEFESSMEEEEEVGASGGGTQKVNLYESYENQVTDVLQELVPISRNKRELDSEKINHLQDVFFNAALEGYKEEIKKNKIVVQQLQVVLNDALKGYKEEINKNKIVVQQLESPESTIENVKKFTRMFEDLEKMCNLPTSPCSVEIKAFRKALTEIDASNSLNTTQESENINFYNLYKNISSYLYKLINLIDETYQPNLSYVKIIKYLTLKEIMNTVLIRIDNQFGDIEKTSTEEFDASEKVKKKSGLKSLFTSSDITLEPPKNEKATEAANYFTRIYPSFYRCGLSGKALLSLIGTQPTKRPSAMASSQFINSLIEKATTLPLEVRGKCQKFNEAMVNQFILENTRLKNVNCIAINIQDISTDIREKLFRFYESKYENVFDTAGGGGRIKKKTKRRRVLNRNKTIKRNQLIKKGGTIKKRKLLKSKKRRKRLTKKRK